MQSRKSFKKTFTGSARCVKFGARVGSMKIQEMKSGISHLKRKVESDVRENFYLVQPPFVPPAPDSELDEARWSVVSFDQREAGGLTYEQAQKVMSELDSLGVAGLYIVTDKAAERISVRQAAKPVDQAAG